MYKCDIIDLNKTNKMLIVDNTTLKRCPGINEFISIRIMLIRMLISDCFGGSDSDL
jgi:hypothetical protein